MSRWIVALAAALALGACQKSEPPKPPTPPPPVAVAKLSFGAACASDAQCEGGLCAEFDSSGRRCTRSCRDAAECPAGAGGAKCNRNGWCRP